MLEKPISDADRVPDVFELSRRVNEPFQKRVKRMSKCSPPNPQVEEFFEEGCPNFGGGYVEPMIPEERSKASRQQARDDKNTALVEQVLNERVEPEPMPTKNDLPYMWPRAMERFAKLAQARDDFGAKKYGTRLQPFNGRNATTDALQELLDAFVYFEQILFEDTYKQAVVDAAIDFVSVFREHYDRPEFQRLVKSVDALILMSRGVDKA